MLLPFLLSLFRLMPLTGSLLNVIDAADAFSALVASVDASVWFSVFDLLTLLMVFLLSLLRLTSVSGSPSSICVVSEAEHRAVGRVGVGQDGGWEFEEVLDEGHWNMSMRCACIE